MYVCICHSVTERQIHRAVAEGVLTFEQLRAELGVSTGCGTCRDHARRVFRQALLDQFPAMPVRVLLPGPVAA